MPRYTYVTPIFITEMVHLITYVQLFQMTGKVKVMGYIALVYSYQVGFCKALQL